MGSRALLLPCKPPRTQCRGTWVIPPSGYLPVIEEHGPAPCVTLPPRKVLTPSILSRLCRAVDTVTQQGRPILPQTSQYLPKGLVRKTRHGTGAFKIFEVSGPTTQNSPRRFWARAQRRQLTSPLFPLSTKSIFVPGPMSAFSLWFDHWLSLDTSHSLHPLAKKEQQDNSVLKMNKGLTWWSSGEDFSARGTGLIPGQGTKIPHASRRGPKNIFFKKGQNL